VENAPALEVEIQSLPWEARINSVLGSQLSDQEKARLLLQTLPHVPGEGQAEVADAALELLPDGAYASVALPIVLDSHSHGAALSVFFRDLLERPDPVTLPALLQLLAAPEHPFAQSARETLALLLDADHGNDPTTWKTAVEAQ